MKQLDLTDDERQFLNEQRALALDLSGKEVFAGLSRDESDWFCHEHRTWFDKRHSPNWSEEDRDRYHELSEKHELARVQAVLLADRTEGTA